jgi:hypothetical protein
VTAAEDAAFHGETASLVVGQAPSSATVHRAENAILLEQVVNDRLLVSIDPAREQPEEEGERAAAGPWRELASAPSAVQR